MEKIQTPIVEIEQPVEEIKKDGRKGQRTQKQIDAFAKMRSQPRVRKERVSPMEKPQKVVKSNAKYDSESDSDSDAPPKKTKKKRSTTIHNYYYGGSQPQPVPRDEHKEKPKPVPQPPLEAPKQQFQRPNVTFG